jgi:hypothetical protein
METITITLEADKFDMTHEDTARAVYYVASQLELSGAKEGVVVLTNAWGREAIVGKYQKTNN